MSAERKRKIDWVARAKTALYLNETANEATKKGRIAAAKYLNDTSRDLLKDAFALPTLSSPEKTTR
jgi:hypothetical protein